jgi:hypothetical protein
VIRLFGFFGIVAAAAGGALLLVSASGDTLRLGYEVARLETEHRELVEETRKLEMAAARLRTAAHLKERVESFGLDVVPPEDDLADKVAAADSSETKRGTRTGGRRR